MKYIYLFSLTLFTFLILESCDNNSNEQGQKNKRQHLAGKISNSFPNIGIQIKDAREKKGITINQLALETGLSLKNVKNIERGVAVPTRDVLVDIERYLDCEIIMDASW